MTFDWNISFGQIVNAVIVVLGGGFAVMKLYYALDKRMQAFEHKILAAEKTLLEHASRMERWETTLLKVVSDLQRLIGRMETIQTRSWNGEDRRDRSN